jgi:predicted transcriptional regulator
MNSNADQEAIERLDRLELVDAIREGLKDVEDGRVRDAREALEELGAKLGCHGSRRELREEDVEL